ncbi:MAG: TIGR03619 family F420-dependent LLM class oxidoreductase [bacterium]|nr:TIGR03619 family F420-dependent LLM class oxidoreductase [bacterium]
MSRAHTPADLIPALSLQPANFSAEDPGVGGWRHLLDQGTGADKAGIDRLVVSDHVILGENLEVYGDPKAGGMEGGVQPTGPDGHWLDPLTVIAMWAARTTHARFLTAILIAPLRRPATLAKQLATIDVLSEGRLDIGVGVGWQREEYEANGVEYAGRGRLLDETLEICQVLWTQQAAAFHSDRVQFEKIHLNPKPLIPTGVPLWISGTLNKNVLRRIARFGSGWIPWGPDAMDPIGGIAKIAEVMEKAGRDMKGFQTTSYLQIAEEGGKIDAAKTMALVGPMAEAGVTDFRVTLNLPKEEAAVEAFLSPLVEAFRKEAGRT